MYEKTFESTKLAAPGGASPQNWTQMIFVTPWDAFFCVNLWEWARVFRDGTKVAFGVPSGGYTPLPRVGGYAGFYSGNGRVYGAYEIDQLPNPNEILNPEWAIDYGKAPSSSSGAFIDDLNQVYLWQSGYNWMNISDLKTGAALGAIQHNAGERFKTIAWVQHGQVAGICSGSGKVKILDYLYGLNVVESGRIDPHRVAAYDSAFHVLVAIGTDNKTRVYCREAWPYVLSNPVFEPAQVYGLKGNTVKVRLTGQEGEPCPGWWIHWQLEGVGGPPLGYLDKYVSRTDKNGYAWNTYFGPDDNAVGQTKVKAWVVLA
jgi:hypothetical protein